MRVCKMNQTDIILTNYTPRHYYRYVSNFMMLGNTISHTTELLRIQDTWNIHCNWITTHQTHEHHTVSHIPAHTVQLVTISQHESYTSKLKDLVGHTTVNKYTDEKWLLYRIALVIISQV